MSSGSKNALGKARCAKDAFKINRAFKSVPSVTRI